MRRWRCAIGVAFLVGVAPLAQVTDHRAAAAAEPLRYHFSLGSHFSVRVRGKQSATIASKQPGASGTQQQDSTDITSTVEQVYPDGSALIRFRYANVTISSTDTANHADDARQTFAPATFSRTVHVSPQGSVLPGGHIFGTSPVSSTFDDPLQALSLAQLPTEAVSTGDRWKITPTLAQDLKLSDVHGVTSSEGSATLLGVAARKATIRENQSPDYKIEQGGDTLSATVALTRTQSLVLDSAMLIGQHTIITTLVKIGGAQGDSTEIVREVRDASVIPDVPQSTAPLPISTGPLATLATTVVGPVPHALVLDPAGGHVFTADTGADTVTMLDLQSGKSLRTITVGAGPQVIALDAPHRRVVVASSGTMNDPSASGPPGTPSSVSILDADTGTVLHSLRVNIDPQMIAVDGRHARAYIASEKNTILVLDTTSGAMLQPLALPAGTRTTAAPIVDAVHGRLFALIRNDGIGRHGGALIAFDTGTGSVLRTATFADANLEALAYAGRIGRLFVSGEAQGEGVAGGGVLHTYDADTGRLLHSEQGFGDEPLRLVVDDTAGYLFALDGAGRKVLIADPSTGKRLRAIAVREQPDLLGLDEARGLLYVAHDTGNIGVISVATGAVLGYSPIGQLPYGLALDRASGHVFVANAGDGTVTVLAPRLR